MDRLKAQSRHGVFAVGLLLLEVLVGAGCERDDAALGVAPPSAVAASSGVSAAPSASATAAPVLSVAPLLSKEDLGRHTEAARLDSVKQLPRLRSLSMVRTAFPANVQRILEEADTVELYSVNWHGSEGLEAILERRAASDPGFHGRLALRREQWSSVVAWLYLGMTRPFGGMKCDNPHHAFYFAKGEEAVAISVCFECGVITMRGARSFRANVVWDPAFRDYLKAHLLASGLPDLSMDMRPAYLK